MSIMKEFIKIYDHLTTEEKQKESFRNSNLMQNNPNIEFTPTNLKDIFQFLDLESILAVSLVNKEFNFFVINYYHFFIKKKKVLKIQQPKINKSSSVSPNKNNQNSKISFSNFFGFTKLFSINENIINEKSVNEILDLHESVLKSKLKQFEVKKRLNEIRTEISSFVGSKKFNVESEYTSKSSLKNTSKLDKDTIAALQLEKENEVLLNEIEALKKEIKSIKRKCDYLEMTDNEKCKALLSVKSYLKNNLKDENIKVEKNPYFKSHNLSKIEDFDVSTITYYNHYVQQD